MQRNILFRISWYALQHRWIVLAAWITLIGVVVLMVAAPRLLGNAVDVAIGEAVETQQTNALWFLGGALLAMVAGRGLLQYLNLFIAETLSHRVAYQLRYDLYNKWQHLSFAYHDKEHTGNLMSKATVDIEMLRMFVSMGLIRSFQIVFMVGFSAIMMAIIDWQLAAVSLLFVPAIAFRSVWISSRLRTRWRHVQQEMGRMTTVLQENLTGIKVVKAFGAERHERSKFLERADAVYSQTLDTERMRAANFSLMQFIFWGGIAAILWFGGRGVTEDRLTPGDLTAFIFLMIAMVPQVRMMGFTVNTFARAQSAGERVFEVLDARSPVSNRADSVSLNGVAGHVSFEKVSFQYDLQSTLREVDLDVPPGQVIALLGAPGSGKTTMVHLLARFYDVTEGRITIDRVDIRDVALDSLRKIVGLVQQDVFLFSATIHENIAYGHMDATREEVMRAAQIAQLHDEIMELPDGYDTIVGERGVTLSGGQRQRLSIARTLLLDPPILVLDDSTSSVDAETESKIQQAMASVVQGRTTFIIAHRLTSIQHADKVVVLDHGRIAEVGTKEELRRHDGFFSHIAALQATAAEVTGGAG